MLELIRYKMLDVDFRCIMVSCGHLIFIVHSWRGRSVSGIRIFSRQAFKVLTVMKNTIWSLFASTKLLGGDGWSLKETDVLRNWIVICNGLQLWWLSSECRTETCSYQLRRLKAWAALLSLRMSSPYDLSSPELYEVATHEQLQILH